MTKHYAYALHELQFVADEKKLTVAPGTTLPLSKDVYDDFFGLNAIRAATEDEIKIAKGGDAEGVTEAPVAPTAAEIEAAKEAADKLAAETAAKDADKKASVAAAAETDRARESAKAPKTATKPADPLA